MDGMKDLVRGGDIPPAAGAPLAPPLPARVAAVAPGIEVRFRALVKQIKATANFNQSADDNLGIENAQQTGPGMTTIQPVIEVQIRGNCVAVDWDWDGNSTHLDICDLQVDRGDGEGFLLLAYDTTPVHIDRQPFPTVPTKWTYKAIYRIGDARIGQWSNPVSVTVGG